MHDTGTGKSVTGAHIAYVLALKLRRDLHSRPQPREQAAGDGEAPPRPCVMYVGPSQHSVNVVLGE